MYRVVRFRQFGSNFVKSYLCNIAGNICWNEDDEHAVQIDHDLAYFVVGLLADRQEHYSRKDPTNNCVFIVCGDEE